MRQIISSAFVAAVVCAVFFVIEERFDDEAAVSAEGGSRPPVSLRYTDEPAEDSWVAGARGAGADDRVLSSAANSICFLTKIEVKGVQGADDAGTCRVSVDGFTGFWQVTAEVPEGSRSEIRCNARCLVWE